MDSGQLAGLGIIDGAVRATEEVMPARKTDLFRSPITYRRPSTRPSSSRRLLENLE
jgi:hypothetical protein